MKRRFKIGGKVYEAATIERVKMGDLLKVETETFGLLGDEENGVKQGLTWPYVMKLNEIVSELDEDELLHHRIFPVFIALLVWASKRNAGEVTSFFDAADSFTLDDLEFLDEPGDHQAPANPPKARPKGSGRAGKRPAAGKPAKTSETVSSPA